jgi:hypothetical protein
MSNLNYSHQMKNLIWQIIKMGCVTAILSSIVLNHAKALAVTTTNINENPAKQEVECRKNLSQANFTQQFFSLAQFSHHTIIPFSQIVAINTQPEPIEVSVNPVTLSVPLPQQREEQIQPSPYFLNIEGIEYNPRNVVPYDIYLNLPTGTTPNPQSPHYAGKLALFAHPQGGRYTTDITEVVENLKQSNLLKNGQITVTIVPPQPGKFTTTRDLQTGRESLPNPVIRFRQITITRSIPVD